MKKNLIVDLDLNNVSCFSLSVCYILYFLEKWQRNWWIETGASKWEKGSIIEGKKVKWRILQAIKGKAVLIFYTINFLPLLLVLLAT